MSICDNTTVNQETLLKLQSIRKTKTCRNACKKLSITLELDGVPRYFSTRYCRPLPNGFSVLPDKKSLYACANVAAFLF